ncbi:MAG: PfkB family carbohydrate kinase [Pirellulales bacterium]
MSKSIDCVVCGTCVVDILVRPVSLEAPIGGNRLWHVEPLQTAVGGLVSNTGTAMARLGQRVSAFSRVGNDAWAAVLHDHFQREGIDSHGMIQHPGDVTGATAVLIDSTGERSFAHHIGACAALSIDDFRAHHDLFRTARLVLVGYYSLLPALEPDLAQLFAELKQLGCLTALDAAGQGGGLEPLAGALPYLDYYVPSLNEATNQTGETDPERIVEVYRAHGATGMLGVKLGSKGAMLSPKPDEVLYVPCAAPPGPVVDTTGAGDAFYGGLLAGMLRGFEPQQAAKLAATAAACCVTGYGATAGLRNWDETARLAGL